MRICVWVDRNLGVGNDLNHHGYLQGNGVLKEEDPLRGRQRHRSGEFERAGTFLPILLWPEPPASTNFVTSFRRILFVLNSGSWNTVTGD